MITGFNTDVDFQGVTYHVQTEDKGLATPFILSLVYNRGTILASKRSPYEDLVEQGFDEKVLAERLQKQHKTICAAIRAGRIEQLKEMTAKDSAARKKKSAADNSPNIQKPAEARSAAIPPIKPNPLKVEQKPEVNFAPKNEPKISQVIQKSPPSAEQPPVKTISNSVNKVSVYKGSESPIPKPKYDFTIKPVSPTGQTVSQQLKPDIPKPTTPFNDDELIIEAFEIIEIDDEMILPAEAVEIIEAVPQKPADNKLKLEIFGDDIFKSGEKKTISILVCRGLRENGINNAQVMIKVLGAAFRPLIFHGRTDQQGVAKIHLQMPLFKQGRAAILIKAMSDGEETELRRTIKHK